MIPIQKKVRYINHLAIILLLSSVQSIYANQDIDTFDLDIESLLNTKFSTLATGTLQNIADTPAVISVITAFDIETMGATDLDEVLETVPGLHVTYDKFTYTPIYSIRGVYSAFNPQVLVLINGVSIKTLYAGNRSPIWAGMPVKMIKKIEVIRGPGSAMYGADAFARVINIITKQGDDINATVAGVRAGSFNTKGAWLIHGKEYGKTNLSFSLEYFNTDGHDGIIKQDAQTYLDTVFNTTASLAPGSVNLGRRGIDSHLDISHENWRLHITYQGRRDVELGAGTTGALDDQGRYTDDRINTALIYNNKTFSENWEVEGKLTHLNTSYKVTENLHLFPKGAVIGGQVYPNGFISNPGIAEKQTSLSLSTFYKGLSGHILRFGAGAYYGNLYKVSHTTNNGINPQTRQTLSPNSPLINVSGTPYAFANTGIRKSWFAFAQDAWEINDHFQLTSGIRYDHYSDFGSTLNPRLALVWHVTDKFTTKLLYAQAFRAPAFFELHSKNNPVILGNIYLKPEKMTMRELVFNYQLHHNLYISSNFFSYKVTDSIQRVPNDNGTFTMQNTGIQKGKGLEVEVEWKPSFIKRFTLSGNYAYQDAVNDITKTKIAHTPRQQFYLKANWKPLPSWNLSTQANWVMNRERVVNDPRPTVDDYMIVDLTARYKVISGKWNTLFSIRNIFNKSAFEPSEGPDVNNLINIPYDLPLAGRSAYIEFNYQF